MNQKERDTTLLQAMKAGKESAFKQIFDLYYPTLCYAAYKIFPDQHKSKDFAQEVFLDLWKRRESINIQSSLVAFLRRAVVNKAIDHVRAQRFNFGDIHLKDQAKTILPTKTEFSELKDIILKAVDNLPDRCSLIFRMSRFEELSHKEIAQRLDISEKTIENQITKALKVLRQVVENYNAEIK